MDRHMSAALDRYITGNWGNDQFREYAPEHYVPKRCQQCKGFLKEHAERTEVVKESVEYGGDADDDTILAYPIEVIEYWDIHTCARCGHKNRVQVG